MMQTAAFRVDVGQEASKSKASGVLKPGGPLLVTSTMVCNSKLALSRDAGVG